MSLSRACLALVALTLEACPDTKGRLDRFLTDSEPLRLTPAGVPCGGPVDASGDYFIAAAVAIAPDKPILFRGNLVVDLGAKTVKLDMFALNYTTRAEVGEVISATAELADDGTFRLDFGETAVAGAADPIIPGVDVAATMAFVGCTRSVTRACGLIEGAVSQPTPVPLAGSTWGGVALTATDDIVDAPVVTSCAAAAATP